MKELYQARDRIEAQLLKDYLVSHHIQTVIQGEFLSGAAGELPAFQFPVLWVLEDRDWSRGKQLIEHFLLLESESLAWTCGQCGEQNEGQFNLCWKCANMRGRSGF